MKIASFDEPRPRGAVIGKQVTGPRLTEAENFFKCDNCRGWPPPQLAASFIFVDMGTAQRNGNSGPSHISISASWICASI
jgi:hypothetical protein